MVTRVDKFLGGLGIDATGKFEVEDNANVTVGNGTTTGNVAVGGSLGIGTSSPSAALHVRDEVNNRGGLYVENASTDSWGIEIGAHSSSSESDLVFNQNSVIGSQDSLSFVAEQDGYWRWMAGDGTTSHKTGTSGSSQVMKLDAGGNVTISGDMTSSGTVTANDFSGDGSNLTNVVPTTHLAVGSYAMLMYYNTNGVEVTAGSTVAGSSLRHSVTPSSHSHVTAATDSASYTQPAFFSESDTGGSDAGTACSGTWRLMGMNVPGRTTFTRTDNSGESPTATTYYAWFFGLFVRTV